MKTVVGLFDSFDDAQTVVDELVSNGFNRSVIKLENEAKGEFAFETSDEVMDSSSPVLIGGLTNLGVPHEDARLYAEGVNRGGTLVSVTTSDDKASLAYEIMTRLGSIDLKDRMKTWQQSGWSLGESATMDKRSTIKTEKRELKTGEQVLPVIEEELRVGKREIETGGVRATTKVTQTPVEEQVNLREEHVRVERRAVDRDLSQTDINSLKDRTIEVRERSEEAVISKRPRVIEEVIIGKEVGQRTETVRENLKKTDVKVEKIQGETVTSKVRFEDLDTDFRTHYKGLRLSDTSYDDFLPVYRYGYSLGTDPRYTSSEWTVVEPDARRYWEERNPGTWEKFKDAVRYAWDRVRGHR